jgi:Fic family protein
MKIADFTDGKHGDLIHTLQNYDAYVPRNLPPGLEYSWQLGQKISIADRALSELAGATRTLPNPHLLLTVFYDVKLSYRVVSKVRKRPCRIYSFEAAGEASKQSDVQEVANYVKALNYGLARLNEFPLSIRFVRGSRTIDERRSRRRSASYARRSSSFAELDWKTNCSLMEAIYVPPPVEEMKRCLGELEKYLHAESELPPLIRLALIHYQFEAIHPFIDGNGRVGRLLITLLLIKKTCFHNRYCT